MTGRRGFWALLVVEATGAVGTRVSQLAVPWLVLTDTGSPAMAGLVGTVEIAPYVVMQVIGGPLVDRFGARRTMIANNAVSGACLLVIPMLSGVGHLSVAAVLVAVFVVGCSRGPADIAARVTLPVVAEAAGTSIDRAAALIDGAGRAALLVGAPTAGAVLAMAGGPATVMLSSVALVLAAAVAAWVPTWKSGAGKSDGVKQIAIELHEGVAYLRRQPLLRSICGMVFVCNVADAAMSGLLLLLWVRSEFGGPARAGLLLAMLAAGAVVGTVVTAAAGTRMPRRMTFACAFLLAGAPRFIVLVVPLPFAVVAAVWVVSGVAAGAINPLLGAAQYEMIAPALQARVLGAVNAVAWLGVPFGALVAGVAVSHLGLTTTLVCCAVAYFVTTLDPFVRSSWSGLNRVQAQQSG
ncbi:MFS transporter [Williamsia sterculiae]|uniref:Major Facilitator Superfamily protein n=1 Tax=Williamsia sterculiae TaxID=1344003 RepID=A0A1N7H9Y8_9NOCA|nr:MFS transporter [Williamsia sterculiae]SIS21676.1 Major Facilitator Superfamily protein [Williamsia sterculiae]